MGGKALDSATFLALADEFQRLQSEDKSGLELMVKLSEAALCLTKQSADGGILEIVTLARPLVREFFTSLHVSADMISEIREPSQAQSSES